MKKSVFVPVFLFVALTCLLVFGQEATSKPAAPAFDPIVGYRWKDRPVGVALYKFGTAKAYAKFMKLVGHNLTGKGIVVLKKAASPMAGEFATLMELAKRQNHQIQIVVVASCAGRQCSLTVLRQEGTSVVTGPGVSGPPWTEKQRRGIITHFVDKLKLDGDKWLVASGGTSGGTTPSGSLAPMPPGSGSSGSPIGTPTPNPILVPVPGVSVKKVGEACGAHVECVTHNCDGGKCRQKSDGECAMTEDCDSMNFCSDAKKCESRRAVDGDCKTDRECEPAFACEIKAGETLGKCKQQKPTSQPIRKKGKTSLYLSVAGGGEVDLGNAKRNTVGVELKLMLNWAWVLVEAGTLLGSSTELGGFNLSFVLGFGHRWSWENAKVIESLDLMAKFEHLASGVGGGGVESSITAPYVSLRLVTPGLFGSGWHVFVSGDLGYGWYSTAFGGRGIGVLRVFGGLLIRLGRK